MYVMEDGFIFGWLTIIIIIFIQLCKVSNIRICGSGCLENTVCFSVALLWVSEK